MTFESRTLDRRPFQSCTTFLRDLYLTRIENKKNRCPLFTRYVFSWQRCWRRQRPLLFFLYRSAPPYRAHCPFVTILWNMQIYIHAYINSYIYPHMKCLPAAVYIRIVSIDHHRQREPFYHRQHHRLATITRIS
jgi:hypothetical protein